MNIPFIDLKKQFALLEKDIREAIDGVLSHGQFIMGPEVKRLEAALAEYTGVKHCVSCASGTDALLLPLMAKGIGPGDAVFTTPFTFIATAEVISLLGATPVFVDIAPDTFNIDPAKLAQVVRMTRQAGDLRPAAVIPVDLFGLPADYDPIMALANEENLFVIEDAAQSFGSTYKGRPACSLAHVGATSFFPAKPLGCYGDGGAVLTDDGELVEIMRSIRVHGQGSHKYENVRIGLNARMDTMQAAILIVKLSVLRDEIYKRQLVAANYGQALAGLVKTPCIPEGYVSAWAQYSILVENRDQVQSKLQQLGVPNAIYYPKPLHLQPAFANMGHRKGDFPVSEAMADRILSLPMHPYLEDDQITHIAERLKEALAQSVRGSLSEPGPSRTGFTDSLCL